MDITSDAAVLFSRIRPGLVGALALYCGDRGVAEDLAQEALARAWGRWRHVSTLDAPERWVYRTAFNLARSRFRRLAVERRVHRLATGGRAALPDTATAVAVRAAVSALPPRQRAAIVARYFLDLDVAASADLLGCQPGTVKALTHQAIASLRRAGLAVPEEVPTYG